MSDIHARQPHNDDAQRTAGPTHVPAATNPSVGPKGPTCGEMHNSGQLPRTPEEPLLQREEPEDILDHYLTVLGDIAEAREADDEATVRRLIGEIDAAHNAFRSMDAWDKANVLDNILEDLAVALGRGAPTSGRSLPAPADQDVRPTFERTGFGGPAPYFRQGREFVQMLAPSYLLAASGHGEFVHRQYEPADRVLRDVRASLRVKDVQDFISGAVHEAEHQLHRLIDNPLVRER